MTRKKVKRFVEVTRVTIYSVWCKSTDDAVEAFMDSDDVCEEHQETIDMHEVNDFGEEEA